MVEVCDVAYLPNKVGYERVRTYTSQFVGSLIVPSGGDLLHSRPPGRPASPTPSPSPSPSPPFSSFHRRRNSEPVTGGRYFAAPPPSSNILSGRPMSFKYFVTAEITCRPVHVPSLESVAHVPFVRLCSGIAPVPP
jgi:hypothetical protein